MIHSRRKQGHIPMESGCKEMHSKLIQYSNVIKLKMAKFH